MCNLSDVVEERGEERAIERTVRRLLIKNYPDGEIIDITECTPEFLERIKMEMSDKTY